MKLTKLEIKGFKSIDCDEGQEIPLGDITVLLGANGSGKSNLVSFFKMLKSMATYELQSFVGKYDINQLLYFGPKKTQQIQFSLHFESESIHANYKVNLSYGLPDRLFLSSEKMTFVENDASTPEEYTLKIGSSESRLIKEKKLNISILLGQLVQINTYQFHDTSETATMKSRGYIDDAYHLHGDAGNLAAFLRMLKEATEYTQYYNRIVRHIQQVMPQFNDFSLEPLPGNNDYVRLNWTDTSPNDYLFGPHQISDGSLRYMALTTLLLQPPKLMPTMIVLDEPELGLHPSAIARLAGMIKTASINAQVVIATQSTRLVDEFGFNDIVVTERDEKKQCSVFKKLDEKQYAEWLEQYSLSELWEKNVLGGQP